jgi:hypothetical protein
LERDRRLAKEHCGRRGRFNSGSRVDERVKGIARSDDLLAEFHEAVGIGNTAGQSRVLSPAHFPRVLPSRHNHKLAAANHVIRRPFVSRERGRFLLFESPLCSQAYASIASRSARTTPPVLNDDAPRSSSMWTERRPPYTGPCTASRELLATVLSLPRDCRPAAATIRSQS